MSRTSQTSATKTSSEEMSRTSVENAPQTPESNKSKKSDFGTPPSTLSPGSTKSTDAVRGSPATVSRSVPSTSNSVSRAQTGTEALFGVGTHIEATDPSVPVPTASVVRPAERLGRSRAKSDPSPTRDMTTDDVVSDNSDGEGDTKQTMSFGKGTKFGTGKEK